MKKILMRIKMKFGAGAESIESVETEAVGLDEFDVEIALRDFDTGSGSEAQPVPELMSLEILPIKTFASSGQ